MPAMLGWCDHAVCADCDHSSHAQTGQERNLSILRCTTCHDGQSDDEHHPVSGCKGFCTYIGSATPEIVAPGSFVGRYRFAFARTQLPHQLLAQTFDANHPDITVPAAPPLRMHLLNQIWLI